MNFYQLSANSRASSTLYAEALWCLIDRIYYIFSEAGDEPGSITSRGNIFLPSPHLYIWSGLFRVENGCKDCYRCQRSRPSPCSISNEITTLLYHFNKLVFVDRLHNRLHKQTQIYIF